jgi:hypothetical protein
MCDLNILCTRIEASISSSRNRGVTDTTDSLQWHTVGGPYTPYQEVTLPLHAEEMGPPTENKLITVTNHVVTPPPYDQARTDVISPPVHLTNYLRREPRFLHTRGLPDANKYRSSRVSGGIGLKHQPQRDIAVETHAPLALSTRVGNSFRHHPMSLCQGNTSK